MARSLAGSFGLSRATDPANRPFRSPALLIAALAASLSACQRENESTASEPRAIRGMAVEYREAGTPVVLTGRVEAEDEVTLGFRIAGRVAKNDLKLGSRVEAGQTLARLESQNEENALRTARANLAAAQAQLTQARNHFERQDALLRDGWTTRANHDRAKQALVTAQSQVDSAEAQVGAADDLVGFTELKADAPGVVTAVGPGAGEVVQPGQMIVKLARKDGRDAIFDVPAQIIRSAPPAPQVVVSLTDDPAVTVKGRVREVAPQADPATRTFEVKVGLIDPPAAMKLGASVTGRMETKTLQAIEVPAASLTRFNQQPAVWVVDPSTHIVAIRNVEVSAFGPAHVTVSAGLDAGEVVVTGGIQVLHPGQRVRLLGAEP